MRRFEIRSEDPSSLDMKKEKEPKPLLDFDFDFSLSETDARKPEPATPASLGMVGDDLTALTLILVRWTPIRRSQRHRDIAMPELRASHTEGIDDSSSDTGFFLGRTPTKEFLGMRLSVSMWILANLP